MKIVTLPALADNYMYLLIDDARDAVVIDPSDAGPIVAEVERRDLRLRAAWCTHHHHDHTGGIEALRRRDPTLAIVGSRYDLAYNRIAHQSRAAGDGEVLESGGFTARVIEIPGHTLGAVAYAVGDALFTGDTLFVAGCGRVFEGTMAQMLASLKRLAALPAETQIYCGHEYAARNIAFAEKLEPHNPHLAAHKDRLPSVPSTIAHELRTNPFLRCGERAFVESAARALGPLPSDEVGVFAAVRAAKDKFR